MVMIREYCWALAAILVATTIATGAPKPEQDAAAKAKPACLRCGATCDLEPICICTPGTRKKPRAEYEVDCEPICLAGCASRPWQLCRGRAAGCADCGPEPCDRAGRVRNRKLLRKDLIDDQVCVVERSVAYLCGACAGRTTAGCCMPGSEQTRPASWWARFTSWWQ